MAQQVQRQAMAARRQQEVTAQLLKGQISSTFQAFGAVASKIKGGQMSQEELTLDNECAVALLSLLGANCETYTRQKQHDVLKVGFAHFDSLRGQLDDVSGDILADWLDYMEAALLSKPLTQLQIRRKTIEFAEEHMVQGGGLQRFLGKFLGAKHAKDRDVEHATAHADKLRAEHQAAIVGSKAQFAQRQGNGKQCPTQNAVYRVSGGASKKDFAPALSSKRYTQRKSARLAQQAQQAQQAMEVDAEQAQSVGNAYIKSRPPQRLQRNGHAIHADFPYPCQVLGRQKGMSHDEVGVVLAFPNHDIKAKIKLSNLETDARKVGRVEGRHLGKLGVESLGYASLRQQQQQQQSEFQ